MFTQCFIFTFEQYLLQLISLGQSKKRFN